MKVSFLKTKSATVLWDVDRMIRDYRSRRLPHKVRTMSLPDLHEQCRHVDYDVTDFPITDFPIVAFLAKKKYRVLVGEEQLCKAKKLGWHTVNCCVLTPEEHKPYIIDYDEETYLRAVAEYWESELEDEEEDEE